MQNDATNSQPQISNNAMEEPAPSRQIAGTGFAIPKFVVEAFATANPWISVGASVVSALAAVASAIFAFAVMQQWSAEAGDRELTRRLNQQTVIAGHMKTLEEAADADRYPQARYKVGRAIAALRELGEPIHMAGPKIVIDNADLSCLNDMVFDSPTVDFERVTAHDFSMSIYADSFAINASALQRGDIYQASRSEPIGFFAKSFAATPIDTITEAKPQIEPEMGNEETDIQMTIGVSRFDDIDLEINGNAKAEMFLFLANTVRGSIALEGSERRLNVTGALLDNTVLPELQPLSRAIGSTAVFGSHLPLTLQSSALLCQIGNRDAFVFGLAACPPDRPIAAMYRDRKMAIGADVAVMLGRSFDSNESGWVRLDEATDGLPFFNWTIAMGIALPKSSYPCPPKPAD